jgi:hypothetical protein
MERFHDALTAFDAKAKHNVAVVRGPLSQIKIAQGETKVVALRTPGPADSFDPADVTVANPWVAYSWVVRRLRHAKKTYEDDKYTFQMIMGQALTDPVEHNRFLFFQVVGLSEGMTQLSSGPFSSYARPLPVMVVKREKKEVLTPNTVRFNTLWQNHPLRRPQTYADSCDIAVGGHAENCMVRFSIALKQSGINLSGLKGRTCQEFVLRKDRDPSHDHHFIDPYDFETWRGTRNAYVFQALPPVQPEPMPGLAAYAFVKNRTGIVLFKHYWATDKKRHPDLPDGGHIDLWTGSEMGNGLGGYEGRADSYFLRANRIVFWPIE